MRVKFQYLPSALAMLLCWSSRITTLTIPTSQAAANPSINSNLTIEPNVHCTEAETWKSPFFHDLPYYLQSCTRAFEVLQRDLRSYAPYTVYEFVDRGVEPMTTSPTIRLPKIYSSGERALSPFSLVFSPDAEIFRTADSFASKVVYHCHHDDRVSQPRRSIARKPHWSIRTERSYDR
ncbi:MAG: hypothetical protein L6R36_009205 [Xanthoria steineri]|nr:MAG: hypothetical protein L6R36_009205 [Xanthoria steineri]